MSNVFWKAKTECSYLDGASQTWYIIDTFCMARFRNDTLHRKVPSRRGIFKMAIHHFEPTVYHTAIGAYEPVLHIESGGHCFFTTTVDNAGYDATDTQVTERGNPQTGPFLY